MIVYGIPNCNTIKKALDFFKDQEIDFQFHNYKKESISREELTKWVQEKGWEALVNKKGTTWRALPADIKENPLNDEMAISLMLANNSLIKRPVITKQGKVIAIGFDPSELTLAIK